MDQIYLEPTTIIDSDSKAIIEHAKEVVDEGNNPVQRAVKLYEDSIFQTYNLEKKKFMEYVAFHGSYADIPVERIVLAWKEAYGQRRVSGWIKLFEKRAKLRRKFIQEDVVQD